MARWLVDGEPLSAHRLFLSRDLDEARAFVGRTFCPHRLHLASARDRLDTLHNHAAGRSLSLNYLRYGAAVSIDPGELGRFYLVQIVLRGAAEVRNGRREVMVGEGAATILNPTLATRMTWSADCAKLLIQIDRAALHRVAEAASGHELAYPIVFEPELALDRTPMRRWAQAAAACFAAADAGRAFGRASDPCQTLLEEDLIAGLIAAQPSNISPLVADRRHGPSSRQVKRAQAYMHANLAEPISIADVADVAGCSLRSLQIGFKQHFGCSPLQYLQGQRLRMARYALESAASGTTVGDVAHAVGYGHLGRFSRDYKAAFGTLPSATRSAALGGVA
jgi:AraC-like DNA-binding protein